MPLFTVPIPTISLSFHSDGPHDIFSGHNVTLTCYVEFSLHLDTNISIATIWRNKSMEMSPGIRTKLLPVHQVGENKYEGSIVLMEVNKYDEGQYECEVTARSNVESVLPVSTSATIQLNIKGMNKTSEGMNIRKKYFMSYFRTPRTQYHHNNQW